MRIWIKLYSPAQRPEIFDEISPGPNRQDPFHVWRKDAATATALVLDEDVDIAAVQHVIQTGYGANLTEDDLINIGKDPFLIAAALGKPDRVVVTSEVSKKSARSKNRRIPDVCDDLGIAWITPFKLNAVLDFKTNWQP